MTNKGLRLTDPYWNNFYKKYGMSPEDEKLLDCGEQTYYMNKELMKSKKEFNDNWTFKEIYGIGHVWGAAISSNPNDPVIYYDTRANDISLNSFCESCHGWFGGYFDGNTSRGDVNLIYSFEHPRKLKGK